MHFLIDYENVRNLGMRGTHWLLPTDHVIIFFSEGAPTMEQRYLNDIQESGCRFETYKLLMKRKNGLDFYIATKVGELFGSKQCTRAVLVSNDTGFQAIRDFWQERSGTKNRVALSESIEHGIIAINEASERAEKIKSDRRQTDIGHFYAAYQERLALRKTLEEAFANTPLSTRIKEIETILDTARTPKVIYLDSLRHFGRKDGQTVYRTLKSCRHF